MNRTGIKIFITGMLLSLLPVSAFAIDPPHDSSKGYTCSNCHSVHIALSTTGFNNVCITCHKSGDPKVDPGGKGRKSFSQNDLSNPFGTYTTTRTGNLYQTSHNWVGKDTVPAAGALPPTNTYLNKTNMLGTINCARCHSVHNPYSSATNTKPFMRVRNDNDSLCLDCHRSRNSSDHATGTHPVNFDYATSKVQTKPTEYNATPVNANPANPTAALKLVNGKVLCTTCHGIHHADSSSATFDTVSSALTQTPSSGALLRTDMLGATTSSVNICTNCHNKPNHSTASNIQCADCHAGHVDYDPNAVTAQEKIPNVYMLRRYVNYSAGVKLTGSNPYRRKMFYQYTSKVRNTIAGSSTAICSTCHNVPPPADTNEYKHGSTDLTVCNQCHNHTGGYTIPTNNLVCGKCHGMPPVKNVWGTYSGAFGGYAVYSSTRNPNQSATAISYSYKYNNNPTLNAAFKSEYSTAHRRHASGLNATDTKNYGFGCAQCHYSMSNGPLKDANHKKRSYQNVFVNVTGAVAATSPQAQNGGAIGAGNRPKYVTTGAGSCNSNYCHSNGDPRPSLSRYSSLTINWGRWAYTAATPDKKRLNCNSCHRTEDKLTTNAHARHVNSTTGFNYSCAVCHADTIVYTTTFANSSTVVMSKNAKNETITKHVDGARDVVFSASAIGTGTTWTPGAGLAGQCSTSYCHSDGKGSAAVTTPDWNTPASGQCGACHAATSPLIATNAHFTHLSSATANAWGPDLAGVATVQCAYCHTYTGEIAATHVNGTVEAPGSGTTCTNQCHRNAFPTWTSGTRLNCETCHDGTLSFDGRTGFYNISAARKSMTTFQGVGHGSASHNSYYCTNCHDNTTKHISGKRLDSNRLGAYESNQNGLCASCHNNVAIVTNPDRQNMISHVSQQVPTTPDMICSTCHDVHGSANYASILGAIKYNTLSSAVVITHPVTKTNFITGNNRGLCQVCHSKTNHFRRNAFESANTSDGWNTPGGTNHRTFDTTTNCLSCHTHTGGTYAFYPVGGACDSCHGYPPVRTIAPGVAGYLNTWSSAKLQNYSGGGGVHNVPGHIPANAKAGNGWNTNCIPCHSNTGNHTMDTSKFAPANNTQTRKTNVSVIIDPRYKFSPSQTLNQARYDSSKATPGNTGTCSNVSCHFQKTTRWGTEK